MSDWKIKLSNGDEFKGGKNQLGTMSMASRLGGKPEHLKSHVEIYNGHVKVAHRYKRLSGDTWGWYPWFFFGGGKYRGDKF